MKKRALLVASLCWALGLAVVPAFAQSGVKVNVPFNFTIADKTFPAGEYRMTSEQHEVTIRGERGWAATVLANDIVGESARENASVIFHCYSGQCFLSEIWSTNQDNGLEILPSRTESVLEKAEKFAILAEKGRN